MHFVITSGLFKALLAFFYSWETVIYYKSENALERLIGPLFGNLLLDCSLGFWLLLFR